MLLISRITKRINHYLQNRRFRNIAPGCSVPLGITVSNRDNLVMMEGATLEPGTVILNVHAKFVMGRYSGAGPNLTVIAGNHLSVPGKFLLCVTDSDKKALDPEGLQDRDVILEEDVWIGANVVLLNGVKIGRGAVIAAGTVCRGKIPPYAIVAGNPAKVVGFRFTPEQTLEHEAMLYPESERLQAVTLDKNYKKYYLDRIKEINRYCRI